MIAVEDPVKDHFPMALRALQSGKHVHVEKPPADALKGMRQLVDLARKKIENVVFEFEGKRIPITGSIGLAEGRVVGPEQEFGAELFACADAAMYRAKNSGRNCFVVETLVMSPGAPQSIERSRSKPAPAMV